MMSQVQEKSAKPLMTTRRRNAGEFCWINMLTPHGVTFHVIKYVR